MNARNTSANEGFLDALCNLGFLIKTGADGIYGRGEGLEKIIAAISEQVMLAGKDEPAEVLRFPPLMPRAHFEASGYFRNFANLVGTVHCFCGDEATHRALIRDHDAGRDWTHAQQASDLVLVPAACYPVYPAISARGRVPFEGKIVDACSYCFRHEPSLDPTRMQMFRMHERIYIGTSEGAVAFREGWLAKAQSLLESWQLPGKIDVANDPFFGRVSGLMARSQREQELKYEMLIAVTSEENPTACMSFNLHLTKMAEAFDLTLENGERANTSCVGFGLERIALAVLRHHGTDQAGWPEVFRR